ncbi:hypothetical protein KC19_VG104100 [Ceratodon purpureus]|uniref:Uncharacterized protein n=1 Tax=Ceratodon purpureus TaxID=3225 RepID=A0A8T0HNU7_CERPU|nr:hypothetical protein KC19_VG104100 [Ceratodon purpureus]
MMRGKPVEISAYVIRAALGFIFGVKLTDQQPSVGYQRRFAKYGLVVHDHVHYGNRVAALTPPYQVRIQALSDAIGFKQRLTFVSNDLLDHVYAAEQVGAQGEQI